MVIFVSFLYKCSRYEQDKTFVSFPEGRMLTKHLLFNYQSSVCTGSEALVQYTVAKRFLHYKVYTPCNKNVIGKTKNMLSSYITL
jgi:hypothetical protein